MTKRELIQALKDDPSDMDSPVRLMYGYGDRGRNIVAAEIREIEEVPVRYSAYHQDDVLIDDSEDDEDSKEETTYVIGLFTTSRY